MNDGIID
jgi:hypothetical protein